MGERPAPAGVDTTRAHAARMYDYALGGKDSYPPDRQAVEQSRAVAPASWHAVRQNRAFLVRAVRYLAAEAGVRQFLDIGSGLPTQQNVHEVAQEVAPDAHGVYADFDPLAVVHGQALLADRPTVRYIRGDLRHPEEILADPAVRELIDFDQPLGLLTVAVFHFVNDAENPAGILRTLRGSLAPGSYLALSHIIDHEDTRAIGQAMAAAGADPWELRTPEQVRRLFDGFDLIEPGLVPPGGWLPGGGPAADLPNLSGANTSLLLPWVLAGVGRLRPDHA